MVVPRIRISAANDAPVNPRGEHVLYWMSANRRLEHNHALERAVEWARELRKPLVVLEALRVGYRWASDRHHAFILDGMREKAAPLRARGVGHHAYVERAPGEGKGLVAALGRRAAVVVTDDWPCFFLPRAVEAAAQQLAVKLEKVDSAGLLPLRAPDKAFSMAHSFRAYLLKALGPHLESGLPAADALAEPLPVPFDPSALRDIEARWPGGTDVALSSLPIDHRVAPSRIRGGTAEARAAWRAFLESGLDRYVEERKQPSSGAASGLSPYLHYGQLSTFELLADLCERTGSDPAALATPRDRGWGWDDPEAAFVDEVVTWRELGLNMCARRTDHAEYASLPEWARLTLEKHAADPRPAIYDLATLESAETADPIWNAAQRQLVGEGIIHNYLRMLWAKKILEWTPSPQQALAVLIELNNKYALDGRDPNSYSGIFWSLGRYDRPWPERPVFGTVRTMTSASTRKKLDLTEYLARWGA